MNGHTSVTNLLRFLEQPEDSQTAEIKRQYREDEIDADEFDRLIADYLKTTGSAEGE